jgi:hypothetical protein
MIVPSVTANLYPIRVVIFYSSEITHAFFRKYTGAILKKSSYRAVATGSGFHVTITRHHLV